MTDRTRHHDHRRRELGYDETAVDSFGTVLRDCRVERRLSQGGLSAKSGVHQAMISDFELGKMTPRLIEVGALERALGLRPGGLLIASGWVERPTTIEEWLEQDADLTPEARDSIIWSYRGVIAGIRRRRELAHKAADLRSNVVSDHGDQHL